MNNGLLLTCFLVYSALLFVITFLTSKKKGLRPVPRLLVKTGLHPILQEGKKKVEGDKVLESISCAYWEHLESISGAFLGAF